METVSYGLLSLLPLSMVIVLAVTTRRVLEPMIAGTLVVFMITDKLNFFNVWLEFLLKEINEYGWYILLFGGFGILIKLLDKSGAAQGFSKLGTRFVKGRKMSIVVTWLLGILIFVDEYLNALAVGVAMRSITDKFKVSREFLAYVINSTGAVVCVLVPVSTWSFFIMSQYESLNINVNGSVFTAYLHTIPFMLYAWISIFSVLLFTFGIFPIFGGMKKAELRALNTGDVFPASYHDKKRTEDIFESKKDKEGKAIDFIIPMLILTVMTLVTEDILIAVFYAVIVSAVLSLLRKSMTFDVLVENMLDGFKDMVFVTILVLFAFLFNTGNTELGVTGFLISVIKPILSPNLLPMMIFIFVGLLAFSTGSFWGAAVISLPIFLEVANAMDANVFLIGGAIVSGITFASHACFFSDAVTLSCAAAEIDNSDYLETAIPIIVIPVLISIVAFFIAGFIF